MTVRMVSECIHSPIWPNFRSHQASGGYTARASAMNEDERGATEYDCAESATVQIDSPRARCALAIGKIRAKTLTHPQIPHQRRYRRRRCCRRRHRHHHHRRHRLPVSQSGNFVRLPPIIPFAKI